MFIKFKYDYFLCSLLALARSFWIVCLEISSLYLGFLNERLSKTKKQSQLLELITQHWNFYEAAGYFLADKSNARESLISIHKHHFILLYFDIKTNFYGKFYPFSAFYIKPNMENFRPCLRLEFLSKQSPLSRWRNMTEKTHSKKRVQLHVWKNGKHRQWLNSTSHTSYLSRFLHALDCKTENDISLLALNPLFSNYRLRTCIKALLRSGKFLTGERWKMWFTVSQGFWRSREHDHQGIFWGLFWEDKWDLYH